MPRSNAAARLARRLPLVAGVALCAAAAAEPVLIDALDDPSPWECNPADSPWATDVLRAEAAPALTQGAAALRAVLDPARGVSKAQLFRDLPADFRDLSPYSHALIDVETDAALLLRADIHDGDGEYHAGTAAVVPAGASRDVRLPLSAIPRGALADATRLHLCFTGHRGDSRVVLDNLRLAPRGEGDEPAGPRRRRVATLRAGNVLAGATARASSQEGPELAPARAIDGDPATRWASVQSDSEWLEIHFPHAARINTVVLDWEAAFSREHDVLAQAPGGGWEKVATVEDGRGGVERISFPEREASALRIEFKRRGTTFGYSLHEVLAGLEPEAEPGVTRESAGPPPVDPVVGFDARAGLPARHDGPPVIEAMRRVGGDIVPRLSLLEAEVDLRATFDNPYDPGDVSAVATFTAPSGATSSVPLFWHQPFERLVLHGQEQLVAAGPPRWLVRFTPTEAGEWGLRIEATDRNGAAEPLVGGFVCSPAEGRGFVRVSESNPAYFAHDDGTTFFPIGLNMCWYADSEGRGNGHTVVYDEWLEALAANGGNFVRLWMFSISFSPEWSDTGLGQYGERQPALWRLDHILRRCEELGIKVQLCLLNHGAWSTTTNSEWDANPYNAANGGPLATPAEFLVNEEARALFERRLRYLAARHAHSPALMSWEWFNEVEHTDGLLSDELPAWVAEMDAVLARWDPTGRMRTNSSRADERVLGPPTIAYAQPHVYEVGNWPAAIDAAVNDLEGRFGKPVFLGEHGIEHRPPSAIDLGGWHLHSGNWASLACGAAGGAMTWWWDSFVGRRDLWWRYRGISRFLEGEQLDEAAPRGRHFTTTGANGEPVEGWILDVGDRSLAWIRRADATAVAMTLDPGGESFAPTAGARLPLEREALSIQWWDTREGVVLSTQAPADPLRPEIPHFTTDIAAKITHAAATTPDPDLSSRR